MFRCPCLTVLNTGSALQRNGDPENTTGSWLLGFTVFCCIFFLDFTVKYWQLWFASKSTGFFLIYGVFLLKLRLCIFFSSHTFNAFSKTPQQQIVNGEGPG